jgi:hypothetical protein
VFDSIRPLNDLAEKDSVFTGILPGCVAVFPVPPFRQEANAMTPDDELLERARRAREACDSPPSGFFAMIAALTAIFSA